MRQDRPSSIRSFTRTPLICRALFLIPSSFLNTLASSFVFRTIHLSLLCRTSSLFDCYTVEIRAHLVPPFAKNAKGGHPSEGVPPKDRSPKNFLREKRKKPSVPAFSSCCSQENRNADHSNPGHRRRAACEKDAGRGPVASHARRRRALLCRQVPEQSSAPEGAGQ